MKKNHFVIALLMLLIISAFSVVRVAELPVAAIAGMKCTGYTIIEFGKGINCHGDTVVLAKKDGLQVLAFGH